MMVKRVSEFSYEVVIIIIIIMPGLTLPITGRGAGCKIDKFKTLVLCVLGEEICGISLCMSVVDEAISGFLEIKRIPRIRIMQVRRLGRVIPNS